MILFQLYTPWHSLRGDWFEYVFVVYLWIADVGSADKIEKAARKLKDEETPPSLMAIVILLSQPALFKSPPSSPTGNRSTWRPTSSTSCHPASTRSRTGRARTRATSRSAATTTARCPTRNNCSEWFGWDDIFDENHTLGDLRYRRARPHRLHRTIRAVPGHDALRQGDQKYQAYDFIKREVYEANKEAWTTNRTYPRQYFFNDHLNAGVRSFDYIYSMVGVITGAIAVAASSARPRSSSRRSAPARTSAAALATSDGRQGRFD